ncbi:MAG TPA: hypothetical protein PLB87_10580 [Prolixibacteraceae bacterium]|nr:hypothetical protein [Prolixibacteraceae bacterium]
MKTSLMILLLSLISIVTLAIKPITGDSNTILDQYSINQVGENLYELTYSNSGVAFNIEVCKKKQECCYLLRNGQIEVMYLCSVDGFGLRKMPDNLKKMDVALYRDLIDPNSFQQQSVLCCGRKDQKQALGLIACFFPNTIKEEAFNQLFKLKHSEGGSELTSNN